MLKKFALGLVLATLAVSATYAAAPMLLNYQGRLSAPDGTPKNGSFTMVFSFYDAEVGGNALPSGTSWSETQNVTATDGVFNALLGNVTALPTTLFEGGPSDSAGPLRFLDVVVDGEALTPRRRVASAAYALSPSPAPVGAGPWTYVETLSVGSSQSAQTALLPTDANYFMLALDNVVASQLELTFYDFDLSSICAPTYFPYLSTVPMSGTGGNWFPLDNAGQNSSTNGFVYFKRQPDSAGRHAINFLLSTTGTASPAGLPAYGFCTTPAPLGIGIFYARGGGTINGRIDLYKLVLP